MAAREEERQKAGEHSITLDMSHMAIGMKDNGEPERFGSLLLS